MDASNVKNKLYRFGQIVLIVAVLLCMGFALISTHQLNQSIDQGNRKIVLNYGNQVAARLHDLFERVDISLADLSVEIEALEAGNADGLQSHLNNYQKIWEMDVTGLMLADGTSYLSDGRAVVFENEISLRDVLSYSQQLNISRQTIDGQEMLVFAKPCHGQMHGAPVTGIFAGMKLERMEQFLGDYGYSSDSFLVLTQSDGDNIWKEQNSQTGEMGNCFAELDGLTVKQGDSVLQMQTRMNVAMDGTIAYERDGQDFYMAYVPLGVNYWYLLVSTESDSVDLTELARQHFIISTLLVAGIVAMGAVSIIYLFQRNRSISRYNMQLQETNKANQANKAKQEFLAKISHDIRTPLNGVMGMLTLAKEEYSNREQCLEYLDKAAVSAKYLLSLLNDVLDMSQIESGKLRLTDEDIDMEALLREIKAIMEVSAGEKGLSFQVNDSERKHRYFRGDTLRLKQVLLNVISNAVKYTKSGGWIALDIAELQTEGVTQLVFNIRDNGEGIAADKIEAIFKPFEQVSAQRQGGVGLGLSIVQSFVELMGGQILVESELGVGSTFTVIVPLPVVEKEESTSGQAQVFDLHDVSVLLAEDNKVNAEITIFLLQKRGARVEHVWDGEAAVNAFQQAAPGTYQVILMDIQMPVMNGLEATQAIRSMDRPDAATIPILSMTANAFREQTEEMRQAGMNDFLYKPIDIDEVCRCIRTWVKEELK